MKKTGQKKNISDFRMKKESLTIEELKKVIESCDTLEDLCLIQLGVTTGIRREDIVKIELMNVDLERKTLKFWEEKKDRPWTVALERRSGCTNDILPSG